MKYCVKCEKNFFDNQVFYSDCGNELITKKSDIASSP